MKLKSLFVVSMLLSVPALAFAAERHSANVELDQSVTIAGTQLAAGQYKLVWDGDGPNVTVNFMDGKKTVATAPAKIEANVIGQDAVETTTASNNKQELQAVDLNKLTLQFENAEPAAGN